MYSLPGSPPTTTPVAFLTGYRLAIERAVPPAERDRHFVLYWGISTGGAFLYPLARWLPPDGYLGWGTSSTGLAYVYRRAKSGDFAQPYAHSALRLRERGLDDFTYCTKELDEATRHKWWTNAQKGPRFKSGEDPMMQLGAAALTEVALRLWLPDFLPAEYRREGLAAFAKEMMEPYARKYRVARVEGFHHYLFHPGRDQDRRHAVAAVHRLRVFRLRKMGSDSIFDNSGT